MKRSQPTWWVSFNERHGACPHKHTTENQASKCAEFRANARMVMHSELVLFHIKKTSEEQCGPPGSASVRAMLCLSGFALCCGGLVGLGGWESLGLILAALVCGIGAACAIVDDEDCRGRERR